MSDHVFSIASLAERNHRAFLEREARRAAAGRSPFTLPTTLEFVECHFHHPDGTSSDWSALTHKPPAARRSA